MAVVGKTADLAPGQISSFEVNGEQVAVANVNGQFYAFSDVCTHRGCSLAEGQLSANILTCACHGGQFDVTSGEVVGGPPKSDLKTFSVSVEGGDIAVS
jgi:nitrite reductase/ring-hydroxylating ferredoxin subunit